MLVVNLFRDKGHAPPVLGPKGSIPKETNHVSTSQPFFRLVCVGLFFVYSGIVSFALAYLACVCLF